MKKVVLFLLLCAGVASSQDVTQLQPLDNELLVLPTPATFPKGTLYLEAYELFFLNLGYSITDYTQVGFGIIFPLFSAFYESATIGIKQQIPNAGPVKTAVYGIWNPKTSASFLGGVGSYRYKKFETTLTAGIVSDEQATRVFYYGLGLRGDVTPKISLIAEYLNGTSTVTANDKNFNGIISLGVRFRNNDVSWEIGGVRPLEDTGDLLFFPLVKASVLF